MKILFVTHADFEKPGYIETWAKNQGHSTREIRPYKGERLPHAAEFDFLVVMGGPQSPLSIEEAPYLRDEIELIKQTVKQEKPIIGICLGAQLIGEALGAKTERSPNREIGMYPIELLDSVKDDPIFQNLPAKFNVMHWHSDMPGIPKGAVLLAKNEGCPRQIVRYGDNIYGFQCHLELTKELLEGMVKSCPQDLAAGKYVMTEEQLLSVDYSQINSVMDSILEQLTRSHNPLNKKEKIKHVITH